MALDDADKKFIAELIAASQTKTTEETIKIVDGQVKPLVQRLAEAEKAAKEAADKAAKAPEGKQDAKATDTKAADGKVDPEMAKLQAKLEQLEAAAKADAERAKAAEEKAKVDALYNAAKDALGAAGVPADRVRVAVAALKEDGILAYNDAGEAGFKYKRKGYDEVVTGKDGAAEWLKTDAGKLFLPPSDAAGTGQRTGKVPPSNTGAPTPAASVVRTLFNKALGG